MERVKYSVVIPLYNKAEYIERTLKSVLTQSFQNFEVIVVDDGSTDDSLRAARQSASGKVRIIAQKNQGTAVARNTGIEHAAGEYIAFLDADDEWKRNYLETIDTLTERYPQSDIFVTAYRVVMGNGKYNYSSRLTPDEGCLESYWMTFQYPYDFVWTSATVIRKSAILRAGGFKPGERIGQDLDLWARVARINPRVAYSSAVCVDYHRNAGQNARSREKIACAEAFLQDLEEELENPEHSREELDMIQYKYDLKMTVYVFTCILAGERSLAKNVYMRWQGRRRMRTRLLRAGLRTAMIMPAGVNRFLYKIRLKVF